MQRSLLAAAALALSSSAVLAADIPSMPAKAPVVVEQPYDLILELGAGVQVRPDYPGAKNYEAWPTGFFTLHYLQLPGYGVVHNSRANIQGWSFGPSFNWQSKRKTSDYPELFGLDDVKSTFELGAKVGYTFDWIRPWVAARYGLGGHSGVVGETGLDFIFRAAPNLLWSVGPRASFANRNYMETYFGVTPLESARSGTLAAFSPGGGFKGVGAELNVRYEFAPQWAVRGEFIYEKLIGDAADSPITQVGSENQFTAKLGLTYLFQLKLFNN
ncbi:MipA/OmpV family protein [Pseudorhodoplanes sp.]|uniref:MipA/OmpV family protein n=1 Tax=Pseudorhodoplanes sp. TaxID=1934341 RepID=UPI00391AD810